MINKKFPAWLTIEKRERPLFFALTVIYGIYVLPIILADRFYQDDLFRSLYGATGWYNDARPLSEKLIIWLCGGTPLGDIFPLPLLLAVLLLACTVTLYAKRYLSFEEFPVSALGIGFLMIANPFLLCNLSYRYEAVTMILALCGAILPYVMPERKALWKIFVLSFFMCMVTFTTYQPAAGVYISLWFLELFYMFFAARIDLPRLFIRGVACGFSAVIYKFIILNHYIRPANGGWQPDAYRFGGASDSGIFSVVFENLKSLTEYVSLVLQGVPTPVLLLLAALTVAGMIFAGIRLFRQKQPPYRRFLSLVYLILLPFLVTLGAVGPLLVLTPSVYNISAHSLLCLCSTGLWAGVMLSFLPPARKRWWTLLFLPCLLFGLTFSYTYGNALTSQKRYEEYLTYSIAHDIETINADGSRHTLTVLGRAPYSPEVARLREKYPIFNNLVPSYLTNSSYMGGVQLLYYTQENFSFEALTEEEELLIQSSEPVFANSVYACYETEEKIIICFN